MFHRHLHHLLLIFFLRSLPTALTSFKDDVSVTFTTSVARLPSPWIQPLGAFCGL